MVVKHDDQRPEDDKTRQRWPSISPEKTSTVMRFVPNQAQSEARSPSSPFRAVDDLCFHLAPIAPLGASLISIESGSVLPPVLEGAAKESEVYRSSTFGKGLAFVAVRFRSKTSDLQPSTTLRSATSLARCRPLVLAPLPVHSKIAFPTPSIMTGTYSSTEIVDQTRPNAGRLASSIAGRLLTYSMNVSNELMPSGVVLTYRPTLLVYRPNMTRLQFILLFPNRV
ncbi:hypothetical protein TIFTF001_033231 [Ficus carica]|uniref:Uncharacterized protein n=1 Tax=Ficus carica TaxID=3494 RepID=A0AA88DYK3_FICCA|nr:hypothetical protein TIFTF001_033231 [Ficus carica]